jgi:NAD(P)-dependent dehydrogenase (short-subunit alcohol dehydrogenase family)
MGRASARLFAGEGAAVVIADINAAGGEAVEQECTAAGGRAAFHGADLTDAGAVEALIEFAVETYGRLDVLYNNAGGSRAIGFDAPLEDWEHDHQLNLRAPYLGIKYAAPVMRRGGGGSIISTTSDAGIRALPHVHAYASFKAALIKLTESAAQVLGPDRIRVNAIAPGWIITPMLVGGLPGDLEDAKAIGAKAQPYPRHGTPEDIARCALFLASDESEFITGVTIPVDGGWLVQGIQNSACDAEVASVARRAGTVPEWMDEAAGTGA